MSEKVCEMCHDTGYYGDNGPGISRNNEYHECDYCEKGKALSHDAERRERAEKNACRSIPTPALEAGVVEKMVELVRELEPKKTNHAGIEYWETCKVCSACGDHLKGCKLGSVCKLLGEK